MADLKEDKHYRAWKQAEEQQNYALALTHLKALVDTQVSQWNWDADISIKDLYLVGILVAKLQAQCQPESALDYCLLGHKGAGVSHPEWGRFFAVKGAQLCVQMLDFTSGQQALEGLLGLPTGTLLQDPIRAADCVDRFAVADEDSGGRTQLQAETLFAIGCCVAAQGKLGSALEILERLQTLLENSSYPALSITDIAIMRAELYFDRGDFNRAGALLDALMEKDEQPVTWAKVCILQSAILRARGRFSESLAVLISIEELTSAQEDSCTAELKPILTLASLHRVDTLASLNRLSEAEDILDKIEASRFGADQEMVKLKRALLQERRMSATTAFAVTLTPRQISSLSEATSSSSISTSRPENSSYTGMLTRQSERVHSDIIRFINLILLELHRDKVDVALTLAVQLRAWARLIDSPLIEAKVEYAWALAAYAAADVGATEGAAIECVEIFRDLDMLPTAWAAQRLLCWCLERRQALTREIAPNRLLLAELQRELEHRQVTAADAAAFRLNKWSTVDEEIAVLCDDLTVGRTRDGQPPTAQSVLNRILQLRYGESTQFYNSKINSGRETRTNDLFDLMLEATKRRLTPRGRFDLIHRLACNWLPADTAVLQMLVLPDRVVIFLLTRKGCVHIVPEKRTTKPELWHHIRGAQTVLQRPQWKGNAGPLRRLAEAIALNKITEQLTARVKRLVIIADDLLGHVPFAALAIDGEPLVARYEICFAPSFEWCVRRRQPPGRAKRGLAVAVQEAPYYLNNYPPLDYCHAEITALCAETSTSWQCLLDSTAVPKAVLEALQEAEVAHFACHGDFFGDAPHKSGLLLYNQWLQVADLGGRCFDKLALVVLASCWGANTARLPGSVQIGLPAAFIEAGAAMVMASLWKVPDEANVQFMREFYRALTTRDPVQALAQVQRTCLQDTPQIWSGYMVFVSGLLAKPMARLLLKGLVRLGL